ncbi:MAG: LysR family transcriptional regulator [Schwartzia sp.]|nr:LysR family transcriptional regulator [Schwartzia sp. (in: firmicutes)]
MELHHLEYFLACARCGSLTAAAEELYTTQPHVSMVIRSLEEELGVKLFYRNPKGIELTGAGERVYRYARGAVQNAGLVRTVSREQHTHALNIATNNSSNMAVLLTSYYNEYMEHMKQMERAAKAEKESDSSGLYIRFTECGIEKMLELLTSQEYDLGFLFVPDTKRSALEYLIRRRQLTFTSLLNTDLVLYVGKRHPLFSRESVTAEEIVPLSFIQLEDDFFTVEDLLTGMAAFRKKSLALKRIVRTNSDHMMIRMLDRTQLCNLGSYWLKDVYRQYDFKRIPIEGMEGRIAFGFLSRKGDPMRDDVKDFLAFLRRALELDTKNEDMT